MYGGPPPPPPGPPQPPPMHHAPPSYNSEQYKLVDPPTDGISSVKFCRSSSNLLLLTSWDSTLRLYQASQNASRAIMRGPAAMLDCTFWDDYRGFSGGLDTAVRLWDFGRPQESTILGTHEKAVRCLEWSQELQGVFSGGWDGHVHLWDPRKGQGAVASLQPTDKVYTLSVVGYKMVVGTAGRQVLVYDIRHLDAPEDRRESSLKYQTRCIRVSPDCSGYVLSSVEGRVAVDYFDNSSEVQNRRYAFKCHRSSDLVYPVNAIAFHPIHGTFATGGCDGTVFTWDGENRKKLAQYTGFPSSIASLAFNFDGSLLAIASSYTFEQGEKPNHPPDEVYIRVPQEQEVRRKVKA